MSELDNQVHRYIRKSDKEFKDHMAGFFDPNNLFSLVLGWDEDVIKPLMPKDTYHWLFHYSNQAQGDNMLVVKVDLMGALTFPIPIPGMIVLLDQMNLADWFLMKKLQRKMAEGGVVACLSQDPERLDKFFRMSAHLRVQYVFYNDRLFLGVASMLPNA